MKFFGIFLLFYFPRCFLSWVGLGFLFRPTKDHDGHLQLQALGETPSAISVAATAACSACVGVGAWCDSGRRAMAQSDAEAHSGARRPGSRATGTAAWRTADGAAEAERCGACGGHGGAMALSRGRARRHAEAHGMAATATHGWAPVVGRRRR